MRTVHLTVDETALGGPDPVTTGRVTFEYWAGYGPFTDRLDDIVTLPRAFSVDIVDGEPVTPIVLAETRGVCCVKVTVQASTRASRTWFVTVPAGADPVGFGELPEVDPVTFQPGENLTAWNAVVAELTAIRDEVLAAVGGGGGGPGGFRHVQALPLASWTITHPLGREPNVAVYVGGELVATDVSATTTTATITFATPTAGVAVLN